jgi:hypothetical protein
LTQQITKRDMYGTTPELVTSLVILFGSPAIMLYGLKAFPPLNPDSPILWLTILGVVVVILPLVILFRKRLMPWGQKARVVMWLGAFGLPVLPAMAVAGALLIANGALDNSLPFTLHAEITRKLGSSRDVKVVASRAQQGAIFITLTLDEYASVKVGDSVLIAVKSGTLGLPWVHRYAFSTHSQQVR